MDGRLNLSSESEKIKFVSDSSILINFQELPSIEISHRVLHLFQKYLKSNNSSITNLHPAYCSLLIDIDLRQCDPRKIFDLLSANLESTHFEDNYNGKTVEIPVQYDGEDLVEVAQITNLSEREIIQLHSNMEYTVAFLGFAPGFPYLLGLPKSLICPRKKIPRVRVPMGSVAIGGSQAGIYSTESPGGWQLIGRTDMKLFDLMKRSPSLLQPGDKVRFVVSKKPFLLNSSDQPAWSSTDTKDSILKIENPGFFSTVQDQGRYKSAHLGVSAGGAADKVALRLGNQLIGNKENAAAIEMTAAGATITFLKDSWFAITGADCSPALDQLPVAMWTSLPVSAGQRLILNSISDNFRSYLCVYGGIGVDLVLESRSTFFSGNWGGFNGRALEAGDYLPLGDEASESPCFKKIKNSIVELYQQKEKVLRVTLGPQLEWFSEESRRIFFESAFEVTNDANRLGVRLSGSKLEYHEKYQGRELVSEGIANGAIQVAQAGQPLILFCEQQTTGGYPKIANVINADMFKLGQLKPGDRLRFIEVSLDEAWKIHHDQEIMIKMAAYDF